MIGRKAKKVGSLLRDKEDIERRKGRATISLNKVNKLWNDKNIKVATKLKMYKALVKLILLYN